MAKHPVTDHIDREIDRLERHQAEVTPSAVKINVVKRLTWGDWDPREAQSEALDNRIARRLRTRGYVVADSAPRDGGRPRRDFWLSTTSELEEQLRIKEESSHYDRNRIKADKAVLKFLREKEGELGYEPYAGLFHAEVDRIYAMHGFRSPGEN